ncbi:platelet-activating factor acetylhydrolase-like [Tigriopus californicus]|nr:platelet-activating factor acetylhydrolase-like [Tigriopus californicus]
MTSSTHRLTALAYFRDRCHFPMSSGPYSVGSVDLATPQVFFRLYYPHQFHASPQAKLQMLQDNHRKWTRWLPEPEYATAYLSFKYSRQLPAILGKAFQWLAWDPYLPNIENASLVSQSGGEGNGLEKLPLIVFSHGNGGCRTTYSMVCSEMASKGYLVAAVEHHDGSASIARALGGDGQLEWVLPRVVVGEDYEVRNDQVCTRARECQTVLDVLQSLNQEKQDGVVKKPFDPRDAFSLGSLYQRIDLEGGVAIAGHSFGGASTIKALMAKEGELFKAGFCFDSWMFPIREEAPDLAIVGKPLFFINYEKFQWRRNLQTMRNFERPLPDSIGVLARPSSVSSSACPPSSSLPVNSQSSTNVITIKKAIHYVATDLPLVLSSSYLKYPLGILEWLSSLRFPRFRSGSSSSLPAYSPHGDSSSVSDEKTPLGPLDGLALSIDLFTAFLGDCFHSRTSKEDHETRHNLFHKVADNRAYLIHGTRFLDVEPKSGSE